MSLVQHQGYSYSCGAFEKWLSSLNESLRMKINKFPFSPKEKILKFFRLLFSIRSVKFRRVLFPFPFSIPSFFLVSPNVKSFYLSESLFGSRFKASQVAEVYNILDFMENRETFRFTQQTFSFFIIFIILYNYVCTPFRTSVSDSEFPCSFTFYKMFVTSTRRNHVKSIVTHP